MTRWLRAFVAIAALVGPLWVAPSVASATTCATSQISVAVVVDFGGTSPATAVCAPADTSDSGLDVLVAQFQVTFAPSGLVCSINGVPAEGCGEQTGSHYAYWSYFRAPAGGWSYQSVGPASVRVKSTTVEGWRFQPDGAGNPSDPPPRGSPDPAATCVPETPTTAEPPSATTAPADRPSTNSTTATTVAANEQAELSPSTGSGSSSTVATPTTNERATGDVRIGSKDAGSSAWPAIGAGVAILGLGGGGVLIARRRGANGG